MGVELQNSGLILRREGERAVVLRQGEGCGACPGTPGDEACRQQGPTQCSVQLEVANPEGLAEGAPVALAIASGDQARVAAVVLGLPLVLAVVGALAGAGAQGDAGAVLGLAAGGTLGALISAVVGRSLPVRLEARPPRLLAAPG